MGAMLNRGLVAALGTACAACYAAIPSVPTEGGPAWTELTSDHFIVWTDASPDAGRDLLRVVEHMRQIVLGVSVFNPTSDARTFVIAMRNKYEVRPYLPEDVVAFATPPRYPLFQPTILLSIDSLDYDRTTTIHELAHVISYNALPAQPRWFAEGLAGYFETLHLDDDGSFDLGTPRIDYLRLLRQSAGPMPVADLFACAAERCRDERFYPTAWAVFAYLTNQRPADLLRYVRRLTELDGDAQAGAWAEVLPDLAPGKLDGLLSDWVRYGELAVHRYKVKLKEFSVATRPLRDADVYTARALLRHVYHPEGPPPAEVGAALAVDPTNVVAHMIRWVHEGHQIAPDTARSLAAAHPEDWRAWLLVKLALHRGPEAHAAHAKACSLVETSPATLPRRICSAQALADDVELGR